MLVSPAKSVAIVEGCSFFGGVPANPVDLLRSHVREHNWSVLAASGAALLVSGVGWGILYGAVYWVAMIVATVRTFGEFGPGPELPVQFLMAGGIAMLIAAIDAWLFPHERARDVRTLFGHACDLVLFLPRLTLAALHNFTAWVHLPFSARTYAARLIERLRSEQRVPMHELPLEIPHDATRERVLAALEMMQVVEVRTEKGQLVLRWNALAPEEFRLLTHDTHDNTAGMRRATVLEKKDALPGAQEHPALGDGDHF
jgi:hypothetical protein